MLKHKNQYYQRLTKEFNVELDPRGKAVLLELASWFGKRYNKDVVTTCIGRTVEENTKIGGYEFSAHIIRENEWLRGWDIRAKIYTTEEIDGIVDHLEKTWNIDRKFLHIVVSKHGTGWHIHVNIRWMYKIPR